MRSVFAYRTRARVNRAGRLAYGLHRSSAALITCLVRSYAGQHLHFVDGADGGYALAARELAAQLEELAARGGKARSSLESIPLPRGTRPPA